MSAVVPLLLVRDGDHAIALHGGRIVGLDALATFPGTVDEPLARRIGLEAVGRAPRGRVLVFEDASVATADEVVAYVDVASADLLALPAVIRRGRPTLQALAVVDGRTFLVVDPCALARARPLDGKERP